MWNLKNKMNKQYRNKLIHKENKLMAARQEAVGGWEKKGKGLRCTNCQI